MGVSSILPRTSSVSEWQINLMTHLITVENNCVCVCVRERTCVCVCVWEWVGGWVGDFCVRTCDETEAYLYKAGLMLLACRMADHYEQEFRDNRGTEGRPSRFWQRVLRPVWSLQILWTSLDPFEDCVPVTGRKSRCASGCMPAALGLR